MAGAVGGDGGGGGGQGSGLIGVKRSCCSSEVSNRRGDEVGKVKERRTHLRRPLSVLGGAAMRCGRREEERIDGDRCRKPGS